MPSGNVLPLLGRVRQKSGIDCQTSAKQRGTNGLTSKGQSPIESGRFEPAQSWTGVYVHNILGALLIIRLATCSGTRALEYKGAAGIVINPVSLQCRGTPLIPQK